ncbi:MAG: sortase [Clostridiales bacterium]|nr:sortase [Clostridiales bacterium]
MRSKGKTFPNILIFSGLILLIACAGLYLYNRGEDIAAGDASYEKVQKIKEMIPEQKKAADLSGLQTDEDTEIPELKVVEIDGVPYIGYISIPSLEIELPVADKWDKQILKTNLVRYYGSPYTRDMVIAGHNYKSIFGKLDNIETGADVYFTDMDGTVWHYAVTDTEILEGTDVGKMIESGHDMSLYTCTYGGKQRVTIRCDLEE